jgi:hypothetical protein
LSTCPEDLDAGLVVALQQPVQLAGDDTPEASLGVAAALPLGGAAVHVGAGVWIATLLCLGTRTIVAPVVAVPDAATMPLMLALHDGLGRGLPPAESLAAARTTLQPSDDTLVASMGFVCFGVG